MLGVEESVEGWMCVEFLECFIKPRGVGRAYLKENSGVGEFLISSLIATLLN